MQSRKITLLISFLLISNLLCLGQITPKVVAGGNTTMVLKTDGTIWNCGFNTLGQLGNGTFLRQDNLVRLGTNTYIDIASSTHHSLAITSDGYLWSWGWNYFGQLGDGTSTSSINTGIPTPVKIGTATYKKVAAGTAHSMAIRSDGTLWIWGRNDGGQLGLGLGNIVQKSPIQLGTDTYKEISATDGNSFAIMTDGTLWGWGVNNYGQLANGTTIGSNVPVQIGNQNDWSQIYGSSSGVFALKNDGTLWASGTNDEGGLGNGTTTPSPTMTQIGVEKYSSIYMASGTSLAIRIDGTLWGWGSNQLGQVGDGTTIKRISPVHIGNGKFISISTCETHSLAISENGTVYSWGNNIGGGLGIGATDRILAPAQVGTSTYNAIAAGSSHAVAIKSDGTLWTWGNNIAWQLGAAFGNYRATPGQISSSSFSKISGGNVHSLAIKSDGTLYSWGNFAGQFIAQIGTDKYSEVAAGIGYSMAIKDDETLWTWGSNFFGQLGNGTTTNQFTPAQIGTDTYKKIFTTNSAYSISLALKSDGSAWAWGANEGLFKEGSVYAVTMPMLRQSGIAYNALALDIGLKDDGSLWAGGRKLGSDPPQNYSSPIQLTSGTFTSISEGTNHALAIKSDGTLWAWGGNALGELGNNDLSGIGQLTPIQIGTATYKAVACGSGFSMALRTDGTLWTWGKNWSSELGLGFNSFETLPQPLINVYNKTNPVITWNNPSTISYGEALTSNQLNATADVAGTFTYAPPAGTVLNAGSNQLLSVNFLPADVTKYNEINNTQIQITVNKATPIVSWSNPIAITYGAMLSALQLNATANANGTLTYTPPVGTTLNAGDAQILQVSFAPTDATNYNSPVTKSTQITVNKASQIITFGSLPSKTISDLSFTLNGSSSSGLTLSYASSNLSKATITGNTVSLIAPGSVKISASQTGNSNFNTATSVDQTFCVNPLKPIITLAPDNSGNQVLTSNNVIGNQWFLNGIPITNATNQSLVVTTAGLYTALTTIEGCSSQVSNALSVIITGDISTPIKENLILIYPNPSNKELYVTMKGFEINEPTNISIIDMLGRDVINVESFGKETELIDVSKLQTGLYVLKAEQSKNCFVGKFTKQ